MLYIYLKPGQNVFITSDTHYGHKNICRGVTEWDMTKRDINQTRDFQTVDQMNQAIVDGINESVGQDDVLIHLGDWSFGGFENIRKFRDRVVCQNIHLILGNHDQHIKKNRDDIQNIFTSVHPSLTDLTLEYSSARLKGEKETIVFVISHYPICSWENMNRGIMHLFGHVHLRPEKRLMRGKSIDVGVDGNDLKPNKLFDVIRLLEKQPVMSGALPSDHHVNT